jgi:hypothetical protein
MGLQLRDCWTRARYVALWFRRSDWYDGLKCKLILAQSEIPTSDCAIQSEYTQVNTDLSDGTLYFNADSLSQGLVTAPLEGSDDFAVSNITDAAVVNQMATPGNTQMRDERPDSRSLQVSEIHR